ncbi:OmpA family protein [Virgibacillus sp. C22-A2]|uniref:OmpA family protein n=1 Tax=Virgibacillus tibetensis TaxID=3042313 RepID=A0ABU6KGE6_9BACI|nr:OmpA family protein [Virgibacillus sp. C22-A2]
MKKLLIILVIGMILAGCSKDEDSTSKANDETEEVKETEEESTDMKTTEESETETEAEEIPGLGDLEIKLHGKAIIDEDKIIVEGESNLLPGSRLFSNGISDDGFASATFIDGAEVMDDGSFSFEFSGVGKSTTVKLKVVNNREETIEQYGEFLENATGPQVYLTDTHGVFEVKVEFHIDVMEEMPYTIPIEIPEWNEKPDNYGEPEVWMEAEVDSDHRYLYFHGTSNLMEGAQVGGNLMHESGIIVPFSFGHTRVNPDGTFEFRVPYTTLRQGMYMPIRYQPDRNTWEDVIAVYGEQGENLKGDLIEQDGDSQYAELIVKLDVPDFEPPEDVGLTVEEEEVKIQMPDDLLFDFDDSELKPEAKNTLEDVIKDLQKLDADTTIEINGHTDNVGQPDYNMELSEKRANAVWDYLKKNGNVSGLDVEVAGYGETEPIASNEDKEGQDRNRRVEIVINPKKGN